MDKSLDFFQIYYSDDQLDQLYPFSIPYKNNNLTEYFENSVIAEVVPRSEADLISVCSWRLRRKRGDSSTPIILKGNTELSLNKILSCDFDVAILTPRSPNHQPLLMASRWHGEAWDNSFAALKSFLKGIGVRVPKELTHTVYENHFIATKKIYHEYVRECLLPCIHFIDSHNDGVFTADSGYAGKKSERERKQYQERTGRQDWPIAPFLLERLFSIWIDDKNFNIVNL